ncbi:MAG: DNA-binding response regulator [Bacteroidetes bacterium]|nr:DNA-binding response regulator [Bacteroidota bacterium]
MNPLKAVIVEDEKRSADVLKDLLAKYCTNVQVADVAETVEKAIEAIVKHEPDIVFLDIELPDGSGFKVIEAFPHDSLSVIFVTAYEHYAIKAIKICALDYLLKPLDMDDLISAVNKVSTEKRSPDMNKRKEVFLNNHRQKSILERKIALPTIEGLLFVCQEDIVYCEAESNYTNFFLKTKEKMLVCKPLNYFEEILDPEYFCRTHQSFLVNLSYIKKYVKGRGGYLIMNDGTKLEISVRMKSAFLERFSK